MADKKFKDTGFALACWILVALILLVFFFVKKDTIVSNLRRTNFVNRVMGKAAEDDGESTGTLSKETDDEGEKDDADEAASGKVDGAQTAIKLDGTSAGKPSGTAEASRVASDSKEANNGADGGNASNGGEALKGSSDALQGESTVVPPPSAQQGTNEGQAEKARVPAITPMKKPVVTGDVTTAVGDASKPKSKESTDAEKQLMSVKLCFVVIDGDGIVSRRMIDKKLPKTSSPLTASINALLLGPADGGETLIPEGTRLLGAQVKGGVATLNFSEEFAFNPVGVEGYMAQLMQVVYTATDFSTVNSVQFIINGQHVDYLGSEGEWIGSPLSRASFR